MTERFTESRADTVKVSEFRSQGERAPILITASSAALTFRVWIKLSRPVSKQMEERRETISGGVRLVNSSRLKKTN